MLSVVIVTAVLAEMTLIRTVAQGPTLEPAAARTVGLILLALTVAAALAEHLRTRHVERQFMALSRHALDLVLVLAPDGTVLQVSPSIEEILGFLPSDIQGRRITTLMSREEVAAFLERIRGDAAQPSLPFHFEGRLRRRDGSWREV
ncbi:PAS fold-3 domain protein, partial [mine drainage metagenome]